MSKGVGTIQSFSQQGRQLLCRVLIVMGVLACLAGLLAAGLWAWEFRGRLIGLVGLVWIMLGLLGGGVMWALAWVIDALGGVLAQQRRLGRLIADGLLTPGQPVEKTAPESPAAEAPLPQAQVDAMKNILAELRQLNDNLLLSDDQRADLSRQRMEARGREAIEQARRALNEDDFAAAQEHLARAQGAGLDEPVAALRSELDRRRAAQLDEKIESQRQRACDLMAVARFDEAEAVAAELARQFPDAPDAGDLLSRVRRESQSYRQQQCERLFALIGEHAQDRQWTDALQAAHRLIEQFPDSDQADNARAMMDRLVDNARIQEVRAHRDEFLDLVDRHRYAEAAELARYVVENYPETAAAEELRTQLPRLIELARAGQN
jgi:hypothetical protein